MYKVFFITYLIFIYYLPFQAPPIAPSDYDSLLPPIQHNGLQSSAQNYHEQISSTRPGQLSFTERAQMLSFQQEQMSSANRELLLSTNREQRSSSQRDAMSHVSISHDIPHDMPHDLQHDIQHDIQDDIPGYDSNSQPDPGYNSTSQPDPGYDSIWDISDRPLNPRDILDSPLNPGDISIGNIFVYNCKKLNLFFIKLKICIFQFLDCRLFQTQYIGSAYLED